MEMDQFQLTEFSTSPFPFTNQYFFINFGSSMEHNRIIYILYFSCYLTKRIIGTHPSQTSLRQKAKDIVSSKFINFPSRDLKFPPLPGCCLRFHFICIHYPSNHFQFSLFLHPALAFSFIATF